MIKNIFVFLVCYFVTVRNSYSQKRKKDSPFPYSVKYNKRSVQDSPSDNPHTTVPQSNAYQKKLKQEKVSNEKASSSNDNSTLALSKSQADSSQIPLIDLTTHLDHYEKYFVTIKNTVEVLLKYIPKEENKYYRRLYDILERFKKDSKADLERHKETLNNFEKAFQKLFNKIILEDSTNPFTNSQQKEGSIDHIFENFFDKVKKLKFDIFCDPNFLLFREIFIHLKEIPTLLCSNAVINNKKANMLFKLLRAHTFLKEHFKNQQEDYNNYLNHFKRCISYFLDLDVLKNASMGRYRFLLQLQTNVKDDNYLFALIKNVSPRRRKLYSKKNPTSSYNLSTGKDGNVLVSLYFVCLHLIFEDYNSHNIPSNNIPSNNTEYDALNFLLYDSSFNYKDILKQCYKIVYNLPVVKNQLSPLNTF
ncbi:hypothetical protein NGRA_1594 [Nosema granulosis]|uniref:Uncharacterized protein n=1 Tax=Nosema granulosis TaxID=83296 RepID=A0A9P6GY63_9MICR|nr:hypothetical protein NGRA_1594 [Nosema granulosis]